jgi:4-azaleucine resistance transporter AzlC
MTPSSPRREFLAGVRAELPIAVGVIPFGLIYGVVALASGLPPWPAVAMSSLVFAGSAQFLGARLIGMATPGLLVVLTTFIVNVRHLLYAFSLAPYLQERMRGWRWVLAYLLTDEAYAVTILHYRREETAAGPRHWFWLGSGLTLWLVWQLSTVAGVVLGAEVPASWQLDFALPLTFIGILVPTLKERPTQAAALTAGWVAVLAFALPYKLGLILATLAGILVGFVWERRS